MAITSRHTCSPRAPPHTSARNRRPCEEGERLRAAGESRCCISRSSLFACIAHSLRQLVAPLCFVICVASGFFPLHHYAVHICTRAQETAPHAPSESATAQRTVSSARGGNSRSIVTSLLQSAARGRAPRSVVSTAFPFSELSRRRPRPPSERSSSATRAVVLRGIEQCDTRPPGSTTRRGVERLGGGGCGQKGR